MKSSPLRQFLTKLLDTGDWDRIEAILLLALIRPQDPEIPKPIWARPCKICGVVNSQYMIHDSIWRGAGFEKSDVACIQCFEKSLGRDLTVDDLTSAPINNMLRWALSKVKNQS